jgi:AcrR family transcriptional regulator
MNTVVAKRKQAERQERIERILGASRKLFLEKDYRAATMRDIAVEAELSTGAVYFYFKGKDEIYGRVCEEAFHIFLKMLKKAAKRKGTPLERFEALAKAYVKFYKDYPDYFAILERGFKKLQLPDEIYQKLDQLNSEAISMLHDIVKEGVSEGCFSEDIDSWQLTVTFWASLEGILYIHKLGFLEGLSLDQLVELQINIFERGAQPGEKPKRSN